MVRGTDTSGWCGYGVFDEPWQRVDHQRAENFARTSDDGLTLRGIPINEHSIIVSYGDCSWANAHEYKSQEGLLVCITTLHRAP